MSIETLSSHLRKWIEGYFPQEQLERVKKVCDDILKIKNSWKLEPKICNLVAEMRELNFWSITYLIHQLSELFFWINNSNDIDFLEKTLWENKDDMQLLTVALQDIYWLLCLWKTFNIKKEALIGIIMLNMKFWWANSWGISSDNIATIIVEEVLWNPDCNRESIISQIKYKSSLDKEKFATKESINKRKQWASCPLYAYNDSSDLIEELWSIVEIIFTVINIKFKDPTTKEALFLTWNRL